jgi:dipeptidyl aminopeptidase/acylaminoacyl peptidase
MKSFSAWLAALSLLSQISVATVDAAEKPATAVVGGAENPLAALPCTQETFLIGGRWAFVLRPTQPKPDPDRKIPWVLYAPTFEQRLPGKAEAWMFERFLKAGIAIAGIDVKESYGNPDGRTAFDALHARLSAEGFDSKACLLGRSRGGLMIYNWAAENPGKVKCITGVYPVCNLASYPGVDRAAPAYKITEAELTAILAKHNPIDRITPLAKAGVPIFHIHGDIDKVVPLKENSALLAERYRAAGGEMTVVVPEGQGHNMWPGFFQCQELVDFLIREATRK